MIGYMEFSSLWFKQANILKLLKSISELSEIILAEFIIISSSH